MKARYSILCVVTLCCTLYISGLRAQNNLIERTYKSIYEMLQDVPGLDVKTSGRGGTVTVRGLGSLMNQKPPLFVVDGTIYGADISNINPQDVENITVLKDAASATAYGSQGGAGVILITTKKGATVSKQASASTHTESAYTYFISHKTKLKVFGLDDNVIIEGIIQQQRDSVLVFKKKKAELLVPIKNIKRVEMMPADD